MADPNMMDNMDNTMMDQMHNDGNPDNIGKLLPGTNIVCQEHCLNFTSDEVGSISIYRSMNGYNYASVSINRGQNSYISITYEWQGDITPDFVIDMMCFLNNDGCMKATASEDKKAKIEAFIKRLKENM